MMRTVKMLVACALAVVAISGTPGADADKYQIIYLSTPTIDIDGKPCKQGDICAIDAPITWQSDQQVMKIRSFADRRVHTLGRHSVPEKVWSALDYYVKINPTSTRGGRSDIAAEMLTGTHYLVDEVQLPINYALTDSCYVVCTYARPDGIEATRRVPVLDGELLFTRGFFDRFAPSEACDTLDVDMQIVISGIAEPIPSQTVFILLPR